MLLSNDGYIFPLYHPAALPQRRGMIPERTHGYYVRYTFVCPDPECSYTNDNDGLVFAKSKEEARKNLTLICQGCRKPVRTNYAILRVRKAPPSE